MEEIKYAEPKVRVKINQLASGKFSFEVTTRGETVDSAIELLKEAKAKLEVITKTE